MISFRPYSRRVVSSRRSRNADSTKNECKGTGIANCDRSSIAFGPSDDPLNNQSILLSKYTKYKLKARHEMS